MDLFTAAGNKVLAKKAPLATKMRPQTLDEYVGQKHLLGEGKILRRCIEADRVSSMILYGPPGTGKTTLSLLIAEYSRAFFAKINAVTAGVADIRRLIKEASERWNFHQQKTIVFVDEIHRFNKSQQDALLPAVEDGTILLIGATTENPYYEVNSPLLSRCRVYALHSLEPQDMEALIIKALNDKEKGLGDQPAVLEKEALEHLIALADGDARIALNGLEVAVLSTPSQADGKIHISRPIIEDSLQQKMIRYDKDGENHYHTVSAFVKSIRGSDPDAALYYLARMLQAGEDPKFIARRMIVHAAEDIGLADPEALQIAVAAARALEFVGMPEARIPLAEACIYLATAPKSNGVIVAITKAQADAKNLDQCAIPPHLKSGFALKDADTTGTKYLYPHNFPGNFVQQEYLPTRLKGRIYYTPSEEGYEKEIGQRLANWRKSCQLEKDKQ